MLMVDWAMEEAEVRWGSVTSRDFSALCKGIKARAERDASMIMIVENSNVFRMVQIVLLNSRVSGAGELTILIAARRGIFAYAPMAFSSVTEESGLDSQSDATFSSRDFKECKVSARVIIPRSG